MDRRERKKIRKFRKARRNTPEGQLGLLWHKCRHNLSAENLVRIAKVTPYPKIQRAALREFSIRENLTFDDFYRVILLPPEIFDLSVKTKNAIWEKCLPICTPDHLVELLLLGEIKAIKELFLRIDGKLISTAKAKQILIWLFERSQDKKLQEELWKRVEQLDPNEEELKYVLDLPKPYSRKFIKHLEYLLAKKSKNKENKTITQIRNLVAQINLNQKQE